jgi:hypothetical protein
MRRGLDRVEPPWHVYTGTNPLTPLAGQLWGTSRNEPIAELITRPSLEKSRSVGGVAAEGDQGKTTLVLLVRVIGAIPQILRRPSCAWRSCLGRRNEAN